MNTFKLILLIIAGLIRCWSEKKINYEEVRRLYELCTQGTDLREFCKDCGIKYDRLYNGNNGITMIDERMFNPLQVLDVGK